MPATSGGGANAAIIERVGNFFQASCAASLHRAQYR